MVYCLEDEAYLGTVWVDVGQMGWLGRKTSHYENTPIQMYRKFHHQNLEVFR